MAFNMDDYQDVAARLTDLKASHPDARLQPADPSKPYTVETIDGKTFIVYVAACYRDAFDERPGIGCAWEPWPGTTNYTRNSELQNAETSAWGRAIVAALLGDTKKSVASAQEVRNRQAEGDGIPRNANGTPSRRQATSEQLASAGVMTHEQQKEHSEVVRGALKTDRKAERTTTPPKVDEFTTPAKPFDASDWTRRLLATSDKVQLAALGAELARARSTGMADEDLYAECHAAGKARQEALRAA